MVVSMSGAEGRYSPAWEINVEASMFALNFDPKVTMESMLLPMDKADFLGGEGSIQTTPSSL